MKTPKKELKERRIKELIRPRQGDTDLLDLQAFCSTRNGGDCYRRNRSVENEDDILF